MKFEDEINAAINEIVNDFVITEVPPDKETMGKLLQFRYLKLVREIHDRCSSDVSRTRR